MGEWERSQRKVGEVAEAALDIAEKTALHCRKQCGCRRS